MSIERLEVLFRDIEACAQEIASGEGSFFKNFPFIPLTIGPGDGRMIFLSQKGANTVYEISKLIRGNSPKLRAVLSAKDMANLTGSIIGRLIFGDTDKSVLDIEIPKNMRLFKSDLQKSIEIHTKELAHPRTYLFGTGFFIKSVLPLIEIGPALFLPRERWLQYAVTSGLVTKAQSARVLRRWNSKRSRRAAAKHYQVNAIIDAIGPCPWICEVTVQGHSAERSREKAVMAARVALATIGLTWDPSTSNVRQAGLLLDDGSDDSRTTAMYGAERFLSVGWQRIRLGRSVTLEMVSTFNDLATTRFQTVGKALGTFIDSESKSAKPKLESRLCHALMWFGEARRESLDFLAIVKFAVALDTLAKGRQVQGICDLIQQRLSIKDMNAPIWKDGPSARSLVVEIYDAGRSRIIHGTQPNLVDDWDRLRFRADLLATWTMRSCIHWLASYSGPDDDDAFRRAERSESR